MLTETHRTKDGTTMLIAQMNTEHLLNFIRYRLRQLTQVVDQAHQSDRTSEYKAKLYGRMKVTEDQAAEATRIGLGMLAPYFAETFLRLTELVDNPLAGECMDLLQDLVMRDGQLPDTDGVLALPDGLATTRVDFVDGNFEFEDDPFYEWPEPNT